MLHPHVGDAYFTGDIYNQVERAHSEDFTENGAKSRDGKYLNHIKTLSSSWPRLAYLAEYMEASTVPAKAKLLSLHDRAERWNRIKATILSFDNLQDIEKKDCNSLESLSRALTHSDHPTKPNRLIVCEDISSGLIELLGSSFDIDPHFFRGHLEDHTWFNTKDPWVELPELDSTLKDRSFCNLRYVQARYFESDLYIQNAKAKIASFNVMRRLDLEGSALSGIEKWWDGKGGKVGLIRHKASLWIRQDKATNAWLDPTLTEGRLLWNGYGRLDKPPGMQEIRQSMLSPVTSFFEAFISQALEIVSSHTSPNKSGPELITAPLYSLILGEWLLALEYTFTGLFQIEWAIDASRMHEQQDPSRQRQPHTLDDCLQRLHKWQRRLPFFVSWIQSTTVNLEGLYQVAREEPQMQSPLSLHSDLASDRLWRKYVADFRNLHSRFSGLASRGDKILNIATAITAVQESQRTMEQSQSLSRVTYLAFVFIPLSFVSSFLSMNSDFEHSTTAYKRFFEIAIPLCLLATIIALYSGRFRMLWLGTKRKVFKKS
ncbi:hypothetical protein ACLMJK_007071 [Lecanora helva]